MGPPLRDPPPNRPMRGGSFGSPKYADGCPRGDVVVDRRRKSGAMSRHAGKWGAIAGLPRLRGATRNFALSLAQEGQCSVFAGQERRTPTLRESLSRLAQAEHASTALCAIGRSENAARLISWPPKPIPLDGAHPVRMRAVRSMQRQRAAWLMDRYGFARGEPDRGVAGIEEGRPRKPRRSASPIGDLPAS